MRMHANYGGIKARLSQENLDEPLEVEVPAVTDPVPEGEEAPAGDPPAEGEVVPDVVEGETPADGEGETIPTVDENGDPIAAAAVDSEVPVEGEPEADFVPDAEVPLEGAPEGEEIPATAEDDTAPIGGDGVEIPTGEEGDGVPEVIDGDSVPPVEGVEGDAVVPEADGEPVVETPPEGAADITPDLETPEAEVPSDAAAIVAAADTVVVDGDVTTDGGATLSENGEIDTGEMTEGDVFNFDDPELGGEELPPAADIPPTQLGESTDSVEADLIDVTQTVGDAEQLNQEIDTKAEVVDELEVIVESMRIAIGCGGVDQVGGIFLKNHVDSLYKRAGIPVNANSIATESFGDTAGRIGNNTYAMETIKETARNLWNALIELIQKGIQFVKDQFRQFFDAAAKLKARAEGLARQAGAVKGEAKEKTFKNDKLAATLHQNGKMNFVTRDAQILAKLSANISTTLVDASIKSSEICLRALESGNMVELKHLAHSYTNTGVHADPAKVGISDPGEGMLIFREASLPGNRTLITIVPKDVDASAEQYARAGKKMGTFDTSIQTPSGVDIPVLTPTDAVLVAKSVVEMANHVLAFRGKFGKIDQLKSRIIAEAKKQAARDVDQTKFSADGANLVNINANEARSIARAAARMVDQPAQSFMPYQLNTGVAFLNLVELSMKQYAVQAPAGKPAPAKAAA